MSVSSVKIYINMALEYLDSPYRVDDVEPNLQQAEQRLVNLSPSDAAPLKEQIADIRDKLDNMVSPADARQVSAAEGKLRQARDFIDTNRGQLTQSGKDHVEELFGGAVQFLNQTLDARKADKLKAPVLAEIERIRLQYGTNTVAAPPVAIPKAATNVAPSPNYSNAKGKVFWANDYFASPGRMDQVEPELAQAEQLLSDDESHEADALRNEISALREKLADVISPQMKHTFAQHSEMFKVSVTTWTDNGTSLTEEPPNKILINNSRRLSTKALARLQIHAREINSKPLF